MTTIGVDIEQFVADPYGSGIQRVLQYLAREWPADLASVLFVIPRTGGYLLLSPEQAAKLISLAFSPHRSDDLRIDVNAHIDVLAHSAPLLSEEDLRARVDAWLLPEVSYLPSVLRRFESMSTHMPTAMIGYDALPMTEPANYRFPPGVAANASEYFRLLASTNSLVCISEYSRQTIVERMRRSAELLTTVAHPGADHVAMEAPGGGDPFGPVHFLRLGTMEARKMPLEILRAFVAIREAGVDARLTYVGARSSSYEWMNQELRKAEEQGIGFNWITKASDQDVVELMQHCDVFLSFGTEGYGIPALEAIRRGIPVLFGGTQPAAQLLEGQGAVDCGEPTQDAIQVALGRFSDHSAVAEVTQQVNGQVVPTWSDFAHDVVKAVVTVASAGNSTS